MGFFFACVLVASLVTAFGNICTTPDRFTAFISAYDNPDYFQPGQVFVDRTIGVVYIKSFTDGAHVFLDLNENTFTQIYRGPDADYFGACLRTSPVDYPMMLLDIPDDAVQESVATTADIGNLTTYSFSVAGREGITYHVTVDESCYPIAVRSFFDDDFRSLRFYFNHKPLNDSFEFPQLECDAEPMDFDFKKQY